MSSLLDTQPPQPTTAYPQITTSRPRKKSPKTPETLANVPRGTFHHQPILKNPVKFEVGAAMRLLFTLLLTLTPLATAQKIHTTGGVVQGFATPDGKVIAYEGIPYAAPPVGNLRWAPPQPAAPWHGVFAAKDFGRHCIQFDTNADMVFRDPGPSEDCLNLNVWAPAHAKPGSLPVMVWIYGGGFTAGATSEPRQDGQFLAHRDVVVVSMNYRLGMLGFFTSPELTEESPHHASGNYGLMDQAAAIAWVARNIRAFGGDPQNITIFGESAGSFSVSAQMASPVSKELISKAIGESGAGFWSQSIPFQPLADRETHDAALVQKALNTTSLAYLLSMPAETLAKTQAFRDSRSFPPDIDGYFLPDTLTNLYAAGEEAHIPLLAGWNADEIRYSSTHAHTPMTVETWNKIAHLAFKDKADAFLEQYPASTEAEAVRSAGDYASDKFIVYTSWRWLESDVATSQAPVYRYHLDLIPPGDKFHPAGAGAFHSDDIEYIFGTLDSRQQATWRPEDRALSAQIQQYWVNFARNGDPNGPGLPVWPVYKPTEWQVLHLDTTSVAKPDDQRARYLLLDTLWGQPKPIPPITPATP
jgi:para-nitrobenzyl esterase